MQPIEWAVIGVLWSLVVALVAYVWKTTLRRLDQLDHPTTGLITSNEKSLRERVHALANMITGHGEKLAALEERDDDVKEDLKELKDMSRETDRKLTEVLLKLGIRTPPRGMPRP